MTEKVTVCVPLTYKNVQICMSVTKYTVSVHILWQLIFKMSDSELCSKLSLVWMNDASSYVMVIKIIKLIHGQVAGRLTACVMASLGLPPWAVLLLGGERVAR